jgi:hypothetical protein
MLKIGGSEDDGIGSVVEEAAELSETKGVMERR